MRILSVAAELPWPPHDGTRLRSWHLLRHLAAADDVTLLCWAPPGDDGIERVRAAAGELVCLPLGPHGRHPLRRAIRRGRALAGGPPPWIQAAIEERGGRAGLAAVGAAMAARHRARPFDVVVAESEAAVALAPRLPGVPFVVHRHNVFARLMADLGAPRFELRHWRRFDRTAARADLLLATTPESAAAVAALAPGVPVRLVPNGVVLRDAPPLAGRRDVVFLGRLDYAPNRQGLAWFLREVWPRVERPSGCRLLVVGDPGGHAGAFRGDGVHLAGEVGDLGTALATAAVGVVPLHAGMGIKNKALDLLAAGIPVVATPQGAEGLADLRSDLGPGLVVTADAGDFARSVTALLADPAAAAAAGAAARAAVGRRCTWEAAAAAYRDALAEAVAGRTGARR